MTGDPDFFKDLAEKLLETYTLEEILECNDLDDHRVLTFLLEMCMVDTEMPHVI